ncbi:hypothetical protein C8J56DRAFT_486594 [Mycena floridula]|nr:hypothetical protein C8J56DRAFT_486594 [Mycena floridula]
MSLLSPSESHAFQSFLSSVDHSDALQNGAVAPEWAMYANSEYHNQVDMMHGREALAKATKDLMSLDNERYQVHQSHQQHNYDYYSQRYHDQQQFSQYKPRQLPHHQEQQQPRRNITFPFLSKHDQSRQLLPLQVSSDSRPSSSYTPTPSTSSSNSSFSHQQRLSPLSPPQSTRGSASPNLSGAKRPLETASLPISKRSRPSPPVSYPSYSRPSPSPSISTPTLVSTKPALLSPSQKKANHIQSEQKRRANIRRGYEALCETVPALREAIKAEEESLSVGRDGLRGKSKRGKGRGKADDVEKTDGRAGPRSENVVLIKTIDYVNDLLSERTDLLLRLEQARSRLHPTHPALARSSTQPLWEREWKGGENKDAEGDDDEEEDCD